MSSLLNTLRRCHSTVRGLRKSRAPISGFDSPSRARRAICRSCAVRSSRVSAARLRTVSPVACELVRARSANASIPIVDEHLVRRAQLLPRHRRGDSRGAATRRRPGGPARAPDAAACDSNARSPRDTGLSASAPELSRARQRASMPSAKSVPEGRVVAVSRSSASRATWASPTRTAASISSGSANVDTHGSNVFELACRAADAASS